MTDTLRIALYIPATPITSARPMEYGTYEPSFVTLDSQERVRNVDSRMFENPLFPFADLKFNAQWNGDAALMDTYGWRLSYRNRYEIARAEECEAMAKMLRKIEKAHNWKVIRPTTFGQYVVALCNALGVKHAVTAPDQRRSTWHDQTEYRVLPMGELVQGTIDGILRTSWTNAHPDAA